MKRILALVLAAMLTAAAFVSCGSSKTSEPTATETETSVASSDTPSGDASTTTEALSTETTLTLDPISTNPPVSTGSTESSDNTESPDDELPSSYTLVGTKHLPIVDNQGSIGSCTSEGVTFTQFTVAVSQYMNANYPEIEWDPSSGNPDYIFSPKFTYNYSTGSTAMCYNVLLTDGCLPMSVSCFDKNKSYDKNFFGGSINNSQKTRSWDVAEGQMLQALNFRLNRFEETSSGTMITAAGDDPLLTKIKRAVSSGNAVAICGSSSFWDSTRLTENGDISKKGEYVIWRSTHRVENPGDGGGHCVAIIGYDDNATLTVGGVTMKGAFLVRNSWGNWMNGGNVWMMYDACNTSSMYSLFNTKAFSSGAEALELNNNQFISCNSSVNANFVLTFTYVGVKEVNGKEYPVYTISDGVSGAYLRYTDEGTVFSHGKKADELCEFAMIPFGDLQSGAAEYTDSYAFYALNCPADAKYLNIANGRSGAVRLSENCDQIPATFFALANKNKKAEEDSFTAMLHKVIVDTPVYVRDVAIGSYSFIYWDKDISVGMPKLSVEVNVEMIDRSVIYMTLNRTDKNGVTESYTPGMMENRYENGAVPDIGIQGSRTSFSGIVNPTKREDGWLAFGYMPLTSFGKDVDLENFMWGVTVKGSNTRIKEIRLLDENKNILSSVKPDKDADLLALGETQYFSFDLGAEKKIYFGVGAYELQNVGTGEILSLASNNMTFESAGKKKEADKVTFKIKYDDKKDSYQLWNNKETYVLDLKGGKVGDGTPVQLNVSKDTKTTQNWIITQNEEGYLKFTLQSDDSYSFGVSGNTYGIFTDNDSDNFLWRPVPANPVDLPILIEGSESGNVTFTLRKPLAYKSGNVTVKIVKNGEIVKTLTETPTDEGKELTADLGSGTYLFTVLIDGKCVGTQIAYTAR